MNQEIPKIIHYCWFGKKPLSEMAIKCIKSWEKFFPDYEIIEWNEKNFDINCCEYVSEAYKQQKWAHVSDYVRFYALYYYGGIYFDTDVEVVKSFDDIISNGEFFGCEQENGEVNAGLGCGFLPKNSFLKLILNDYETSSFYKNDEIDLYNTVVVRVSKLLRERGFVEENKIQNINNITIYTKEYFNPMIYETGELFITPNTHSIHWYDASWFPKGDKKIHIMEQKIRKKFKGSLANILCFLYRKGYRLLESLRIIKK